jgi:hypothetical protein
MPYCRTMMTGQGWEGAYKTIILLGTYYDPIYLTFSTIFLNANIIKRVQHHVNVNIAYEAGSNKGIFPFMPHLHHK